MYWFFSREGRRRISRNSRGPAVAMQGPVAVAGAFRPVPAGPPLEHRVCYGLVSADDRVLREGDPVVAGDDDDVGQRQCPARVPELAAPPVHFVGGGPQGADPGRHQAPELIDGQFRFRGERQVPRDAGPAAALRVLRPAFGHVHVKISPCLAERGDQGREHPGHAVLDLAGDTRVLRRDARGGPSLLQVSGLVDRDPGPDQVIRVIRQALRRQARMRAPQFLPRPPVPPEQGLHPVRSLVPGRLSQFPAVRPRSPRQRPHVIQRRRDAAPLPHHPAQHPADQAIRSFPALGGIFYAGHCGRGLSCFSTKSRNEPRPPRVARPPAAVPPETTIQSRHALSRQPHARRSRNRQHQNTQRETATVIHRTQADPWLRPRSSPPGPNRAGLTETEAITVPVQ